MRIRFALVTFVLLAGVLISNAAHASIVIDGNLTDWGVTPGKYGKSDWVADNGAIGAVEDQKGNLSVKLGPGYGGQLFDAEAMYFKIEGNIAYLAIVTGHPQSGVYSSGWYYPGDIAFDLDGDSVYEYGLVTSGANAGNLYSGLTTASWNKGLSNWGGVTDPTTIKLTDGMIGQACDFVYNKTYYWDATSTYDNQHYVMELAIPTSYLGGSWSGGTIHWTQTCGNDAIDLAVSSHASTPEPATMALVGIGLAGFLARRKKS